MEMPALQEQMQARAPQVTVPRLTAMDGGNAGFAGAKTC